ncbi:MAG: hypothetical protein HOP21_08605 [Methylotenera sp.]|nr:hypothetical protein [Methylotenera sp.]
MIRLRFFLSSLYLKANRFTTEFLKKLGCALLLSFALPAWAVVDLNKDFSPINIAPGQTSTLTINFFNSNTIAATGLALTDTLPTNVVVAPTPAVNNTCGGTVTANAGATSVAISGGTIPAGTGSVSGTCRIKVNVTSSTAGTYTNTIPLGAATSSEPTSAQAASATLNVSSLLPITATKVAAPAFMHFGGTSTFTVNITNPNLVALSGLAFTDTLPTLMVLATPLTVSNTCGGTLSNNLGGVLAAGALGVRLTGGTLAASSSCSITFVVTPPNGTSYVNTNTTNSIATITNVQGANKTGTTFASLLVTTGAQVAKAFAPSTINAGATSTFTLTLRNFNTTAITNANITDNMPSGVTVTALTGNTCGGTPSFTATSVSLVNGTVPAAPNVSLGSSICSITVTVTANPSVDTTYTNSVPAGSLNGVNYNAATATLNVKLGVNATKVFSPANAPQGSGSTLIITLNNLTAAPAIITSFADNLNTMGTGISIAPSPAASNTCGGTLIATPSSTLVSMTGGSIPAASSCTITIPVITAVNATIGGTRTNTIATAALVTNQGNNTTPATGNFIINEATPISKSFVPSIIAPSGVSRLTITINRVANALALTHVDLTDNLPLGHTIAATPNVVSTCGGTVTATAGSSSIILANGSLPRPSTGAASICTIAVNIQAPAGTGAATNTIPIGALSTAEGLTNGSAASATLTRSNITPAVALNKSFSPISINGGAPSVLTITLGNTAVGAVNLTNVAVTDTFPTGMQVANVPAASFSGAGCTLGTVNATPSAGSVSLSGASITAGSTCTLTVNVTAVNDGNLINSIAAGALTSSQGATNTNSPNATLTILRNMNIGKSFSPAVMQEGGTSTLTLTLFNTNTVTRDGSATALVDNLPFGMTVAAGATSTTCTGMTIVAPVSGGTITLNNGTFPPSSSCIITVPVTVATKGAYTNTIAAGALSTVQGSTNPDATNATLTVLARPTIAKAFSLTSMGIDGSTTVTFTLTNPNASTYLPSGLTNASFTDNLPAGMFVNSSAVGGTCVGANTNIFSIGQTSLSFSGITVPSNAAGTATCTVTITVTANAAGSYSNTASGVSTAQTLVAGTASNAAVLTVLQRPTISKSFSPAEIAPNGVSVLTFTLSNPNSVAVTLPSSAFTDIFPTVPSAMTLANTTVSTTCAGASIVDSGSGGINAGDVGMRLNGGTIPANGSCLVTVQVTASASGGYNNTSTVLTTNNAGTSLFPANALLTVFNPPTLSKSFSPSSITPSGSSVLTITLSNTNSSVATLSANLVDSLPAGVTLVNASFGGTCNVASVSGVAGGNTLTYASGGTVPANGSCTITANVTSSTVGAVTNTIAAGALQTDKGNNASAASANLTVTNAPIVSKAFSPAKIAPNGVSVLTITLSNNNPLATLSADLVDTFPVGVTLANAVFGGTCDIGLVSGVAGGNTLTYTSGGTIPANGSCTITANVTSSTVGAVTNTIIAGALQTNRGSNAGASTADLTVTNPPTVAKSFTPNLMPAGATSVLTITLGNNNASIATLSSPLVDNLPAGVTLVNSSFGGTCTGVKSGTVGGNTLTYASGSVIPAYGSCTITANVTSSTAGAVTNTIAAGALQTDNGSNLVALASLTIITPPSMTKSFTPASIAPNSTSVLTMTLNNPNPAIATLSANLTDTFPAGLTLLNTTFGGSCTGTKSGAAGGNTLTYVNGATIPANGSCTITATVTSSTVGTVTNTLATGSLQTNNGNNTAPAVANLTVSSSPIVTKAFSPTNINPAAASVLTITLSNSAATVATLSAPLVDTFPAGVTLANITFGGTCTGAKSGVVAGNTLTYASGATIPANGSCTITANVTSSAVGTVTNTIAAGALQTNQGNNTAAATADLIVNGRPTVSKSFSPNSIVSGQTSLLTITLTNPNSPLATLSANMVDTFPAGVTLANTAFGGTCTTASVSGVVGGGTLTYANGATIPANGSCTITATVTSSTVGSVINTIAANGLRTNYGNNLVAASANLNVTSHLPLFTFTKLVNVVWDPINLASNPKYIPDALAEYTLIVSNAMGTADNDSAVITDSIPANTALYVNDIAGAGTGPVLFIQGATSSTLSYTFSTLNSLVDDVDFSNNNGATWGYVPTPASDGCDIAVTNLRINPKGSFVGNSSVPNPSFSAKFRVCVK